MQGRWAFRRHSRGVHVAYDIRSTTHSTRGEDSVSAKLARDVAIVRVVVHWARRLVDRAVEDRDDNEHSFLRVEALAGDDDVERSVVVGSDRGVGAI